MGWGSGSHVPPALSCQYQEHGGGTAVLPVLDPAQVLSGGNMPLVAPPASHSRGLWKLSWGRNEARRVSSAHENKVFWMGRALLLVEMWIHASGSALCLKKSPHVTYSLTSMFSWVLLDSTAGIDTPMVFYIGECWQTYWQHPEAGQPADGSLQPNSGTHSPGRACKCCPSNAPVTKSLGFVLRWERTHKADASV